MIAVALLTALLMQLTVINLLPLPGGAAPDLVLLVVVAAAMVRGAASGAVIGFCAGLLSDLLPPVVHPVGQYALVMCLVGFVAGRLSERSPRAGVPVVVACVVGGPLIAAAVGGLLGDPRVSLGGLEATLPLTVVYTLLAAPLLVWVVRRMLGARPVREGRAAPLPLRSRI
ncbi:rod shape-determining protein MreD [Sinosporangium album]|uniref:Rod shape-determining protein MreD n=1 Tax=Sinosporangium album TaxID=504805 RepID=A0A1G8JM82_9ACTN|nr:rod shape-determining protein MreD [Sinosporangium album]SDI32276.1 rod shape-determining protein MreD [Sinosporangium album]